ILNAIDATPRGGHIRLGVRHCEGEMEVKVEDDGAGIAPEHSCRLFQPYFTTKKNGTGLGLFVTRKLVADHGGTVDFASRPGEGTICRVRLAVPAGNGTGPEKGTGLLDLRSPVPFSGPTGKGS